MENTLKVISVLRRNYSKEIVKRKKKRSKKGKKKRIYSRNEAYMKKK